MIASGEAATTCAMTLSTIALFAASRSSRVMPGLRGRPAVTTTTSRAGGVGVVVGADDRGAEALDGAHVHHVERLALRQALGDVDHDHVGDLVQQQELGGGRADLSRADDGHLRVDHESPLPCEKRRNEASRGLELTA